MSKNILKGKVAGILNPRELAINIGENSGVEIGMIFKVIGDAVLKDPDTGEQLGAVRREKGRVKIVTVEERFATARTFETFVINIGGIGPGNLGTSVLAESTARFFSPPNLITRVQTLKYDESGLELPTQEGEGFVYVKVGDVVELAGPEE